MDKPIKVLLVDDEPDFLKLMSHWFKSKGFSVINVSNGNDALKIIKTLPPDVAFLDIIMPEMDGLTLLKKIREFNQTLPIVLMSAHVEKSIEQKKGDFYGVSHIFFKEDGFPKALELLEVVLKK